MSRVQVSDLRRARLQAAPLPSDTSRGAPIVESGAGRLQDLASALGSFNSSLSALNSLNKKRNDSPEEIQQEINRLRALEDEERQEVIRTGVFPNGDTVEHARTKKLLGTSVGGNISNNVLSNLDGVNLIDFDIDGTVNEAFDDEIDAANDDIFARGSLLEVKEKTRERLRAVQADQLGAERENITKTSSFGALNFTIDEALRDGGDVSEVRSIIQDFTKQVTGSGKLIEKSEVDDVVFGKLSSLAESRPELVKELLTETRTDSITGQKLPSFLSNPKFSSRGEAIITRANKALLDIDTERQRQEVFEADFRNVTGDNNLLNFEEEVIINGKALTRSEREDEFKRRLSNTFDAKVKQGELTPLEGLTAKVHELSKLNLKSDLIETELGGIASRVSPATFNDERQTADVVSRLRTYKHLKATNKNFVLSQLNETDKRFYRVADTLQRFRDLPEEAALQKASVLVNSDLGPINVSLNRRLQDITRKTRNAFDPGIFSSNPLSETFQGTVVNEVRNLAAILIAEGKTEDEAIDLAAQQVKDDSIIYKGVVLSGIEGQTALPDNLEDTFDKSINDLLLNLPDGFIENHVEGELIPRPLGNGGFILVDEDGVGVVNPNTNKFLTIENKVLLENSQFLKQQSREIREAEEIVRSSRVKLKRAERNAGRAGLLGPDAGDTQSDIDAEVNKADQARENLNIAEEALRRLRGDPEEPAKDVSDSVLDIFGDPTGN